MMLVVLLLRGAGLVCGCFYGPALYVVFTVGGLYIAADFSILYIIGSRNKQNENITPCLFPEVKIWIIIWQIMNVFALVGLFVAIGLFSNLGMWAMLHEPIHFALFIIIILLSLCLLYNALLLYTLYRYLQEAYFDELLGHSEEEDDGLTTNGRRISI